jgi:hypothetical protein
MLTTLSELVELIQAGAVPAWLRAYVLEHKDEIGIGLRERGEYTIPPGPNGEQVTIHGERRVAAAGV